MASNRGHTPTVEALLAAKADVNMAMKDGTTALHTATYKGHTNVAAALIAAGAPVPARCHDGVAALLMAAKSGREELVRMLLSARAEVCSRARVHMRVCIYVLLTVTTLLCACDRRL